MNIWFHHGGVKLQKMIRLSQRRKRFTWWWLQVLYLQVKRVFRYFDLLSSSSRIHQISSVLLNHSYTSKEHSWRIQREIQTIHMTDNTKTDLGDIVDSLNTKTMSSVAMRSHREPELVVFVIFSSSSAITNIYKAPPDIRWRSCVWLWVIRKRHTWVFKLFYSLRPLYYFNY